MERVAKARESSELWREVRELRCQPKVGRLEDFRFSGSLTKSQLVVEISTKGMGLTSCCMGGGNGHHFSQTT